EILMRKLNQLISKYEMAIEPREKEYYEFLKATVRDLKAENQQVYAGYFSEDRGTGDEAIQAEVNDILKNKERLLSFKDKDGNWITRRFLFSKWTLREGWDNPNVFVIAKLRTSGSENSKIQEVGRGLRLPVDENGQRVQQEEWSSRIAFLISYDEKDFARKLVGEINSDAKLDMDQYKLTDDMIEVIVAERKKTDKNFDDEKLLEHLNELKIINRKNEFKTSVELDGHIKDGFEWLLELYPELTVNRLRSDKIREPDKTDSKVRVKLKKEKWEKVKDLWRQFSNRHMLEFERYPERI